MQTNKIQKKISHLRRKISRIDKILIKMIIQRIETGQSIQKLKKSTGTPFTDKKREEEILDLISNQLNSYFRKSKNPKKTNKYSAEDCTFYETKVRLIYKIFFDLSKKGNTNDNY